MTNLHRNIKNKGLKWTPVKDSLPTCDGLVAVIFDNDALSAHVRTFKDGEFRTFGKVRYWIRLPLLPKVNITK